MAKIEDVKKPDAITSELKKGFEWTAKHATLVIVLIIAFIAIGGGYSAYRHFEAQNEVEIQERFYSIEKKLTERTNSFSLPPADPKHIAKTNDLSKDYAGMDEELKKLIQEHPNSKAARMAALYLTDLYIQYGKSAEALDVLSQIQVGKGLLDLLVANQRASLMSNQGECEKAITIWQSLKKIKELAFAKANIQLKEALCYDQLGKKEEAQKLYAEIQKDQGDSALGMAAKRYELLITKE